jgi:hypothetical protein
MVNKNHEQEELNNIGVVQSEIAIVYYDKTSKTINEERDAVAKIVNTDGKETPYIKFRRGQLFDPYGVDALKLNARDNKYKKVDMDLFLVYKKYLETRREVFLLQAKRDFIKKGY